MDNELLLLDRIEIIKTANKKYDLEKNGYIAFSGGKDSTILHYLVDIALPNNNIPRVYIDTGIEYQMIKDFVYNLQQTDKRIQIVKPKVPIKTMLEKDGYPFKSKEFSGLVSIYQRNSDCVDKYKDMDKEDYKKKMLQNPNEEKEITGKNVIMYIMGIGCKRDKNGLVNEFHENKMYKCPKKIRYVFSKDFNIKLSHKCCFRLKKEPVKKWQKENNRYIGLTGMRSEEGGQRKNIKNCIITDKKGNARLFHPLIKVDKNWEEWFINKIEKEKNQRICSDIYYAPYNFSRTGCKGCPYALDLQNNLNVMERLMPNERKQCEIIWKPIYDEYRRIGYRLESEKQMTLDDYLDEEN